MAIRHALLLMLLLGLADATAISDVRAQDRMVTDDLGRRIAVPEKPVRIVSLDDVSLTVPLFELGAVPIASEGRIDARGHTFIRSSLMVTGRDFDNTGMTFLGRNPVDVEVVAQLRPDLIVILKSRPTPPEQLQAIAPTVVIDDIKRSSAQIYELLAELAGKERELQVLRKRYDTQIAQLKRIAASRGATSVSILNATEDGKIGVEHTYGSLGAVLRDAGFSFPPLVDRLAPNGSAAFSAEALPELDADIIFDTYRNDKDETPDDARARMAALLPDYCRFLSACRQGRYYIVPRDEAKSITYAARMMAVAMITAAISTLPPAGDP